MMDAFITVRGVQTVDGDESVTELNTEGNYDIKNGHPVICYDDSESFGKGTETKITVMNGSVVLSRSGGANMRMIIEKGRRHSCSYKTLQGELLLDFLGEEVSSNLNEQGGSLRLAYEIYAGAGKLSDNKLEITVRSRD